MGTVGNKVTFALGSGNWVAGGRGWEEDFYCIPFYLLNLNVFSI